MAASGRLEVSCGRSDCDPDNAAQYLWLMLKVIGNKDVTIRAGAGAKAVDLSEQTMDIFIDALDPEIKRAAA